MDAKPSLKDLRHQAAAWVVWLSDPDCSSAVHKAFEQWRDTSALHEAAYEREAAAWNAFDRLRALRPGVSEPDPDLLSRRSPLRRRPLPATGRQAPFGRLAGIASLRGTQLPRPARKLIAAAVLVAAIVAGVGGWEALSPSAYATAIGERRTVILPDDSRVELNTDSKIAVRYRRHVREVTLLKGEVMFDIHPDKRPFQMMAGPANLRISAAKLDVRLRPGGTAVLVEDGTVEAVSQADAHTAVTELTSGDDMLYGPNTDTVVHLSADAIGHRLAWRHDMIDLDGQSLADAVLEFNRYNARKIVIADKTIETWRLGGYFNTRDVDGFVRALRAVFPVQTDLGVDGAVTLRRGGR